VGRVDHPDTHVQRRHLLERCLSHPSHYVIDGAGLGLASMDDPAAIPALRAVINTLPSGIMKRGLEQVLEQMRATEESEVVLFPASTSHDALLRELVKQAEVRHRGTATR